MLKINQGTKAYTSNLTSDVVFRSQGIFIGEFNGKKLQIAEKGDYLNFALDEDEKTGKINAIYLTKGSAENGNVITDYSCAGLTALKQAMKILSGNTDFSPKGGAKLVFEMAETPIKFEGVELFEIKFKEYIKASEKEESEAIPVSSTKKDSKELEEDI